MFTPLSAHLGMITLFLLRSLSVQGALQSLLATQKRLKYDPYRNDCA